MVFMRTAYDQSLADAAFAQAALLKVADGKISAQLPSQAPLQHWALISQTFPLGMQGPASPL